MKKERKRSKRARREERVIKSVSLRCAVHTVCPLVVEAVRYGHSETHNG
jgi:hypothetical protein